MNRWPTKKVGCFNFLSWYMWRAPWRSPCEAMRPEWSRWRNWFSDVRIASQAPNQPPEITRINFNQPCLNSPFNVCVLLSSVWVDSHVQLLQLRAGAVPLIVWRQSELLGASSSAWTQSAAHSEWGRASSLHRGPLSSSAPASRRRATATGGQQLLFHNQSAAKKLFSFALILFTSGTWLAHKLWYQLGIGAVMWFSIFCRYIKSFSQ